MTTTTRVRVWIGALAGLVLICAPSVHGQTVADVLTFLVTNQSVATGSVERDRDAALATSDTISRALAVA